MGNKQPVVHFSVLVVSKGRCCLGAGGTMSSQPEIIPSCVSSVMFCDLHEYQVVVVVVFVIYKIRMLHYMVIGIT